MRLKLHRACRLVWPAGINLPRLDQATPHYGGAWAAAGTTIFTDLFKVAYATTQWVHGRYHLLAVLYR